MAEKYYLCRGPKGHLIKLGSTTSNFYNDLECKPSEIYSYWVKSYSSSGSSDYSDPDTGYRGDIYKYTSQWGSSGTGDGQFSFPQGIAIDNNGDIVVADTVNHRIQKFTPDGTYITKWISSNDLGDMKSSNNIIDITIDDFGNYYLLLGGYSPSSIRIHKYTSEGVLILKWGMRGTGDGEFNSADGIAADDNGDIIIVDTGNHRIQKFTSDGTFITKWGSEGSDNGLFNNPSRLAFDNDNNIYIVDRGNHRIQKFTSDGTFLTKWGNEGYEDGQFKFAYSIAIDMDNRIYIGEINNHRIQKFNSEGIFITKIGKSGSGEGEFSMPHAVAVDNNGYVYVVDSGNNRIQKFQKVP